MSALIVLGAAGLMGIAGLFRLAAGPAMTDRVAGAAMVLIAATLAIAAGATAARQPAALDLALALILGVFAMALAAWKLIRLGTLQAALARRTAEDGP